MYRVHCRRCGRPGPEAQTPETAEIAARFVDGWERSRRKGWICPDCIPADEFWLAAVSILITILSMIALVVLAVLAIFDALPG